MDVMNQRRNDIVNFVNKRGTVSFAELKNQFPNVSDMTLRTDLKALDQNKQLIRIHGGAKSLNVIVGNDDYLNRRLLNNIEMKKEIVDKSLQLIQENTTIFLDSGSTTTLLSQAFPDQHNTIYTCSLTCAIELAKLTKSRIYINGGEVNLNSLSIYGVHGIEYFNYVNFDTVFIGVTSYSPKTGFTCESAFDAEIKRSVIKRAENVVILMDSSKIDHHGTYTICELEDVNVIVSDSKLPQTFRDKCQSQNITVL